MTIQLLPLRRDRIRTRLGWVYRPKPRWHYGLCLVLVAIGRSAATEHRVQVEDGTLEFHFDSNALAALGFSFVSRGEVTSSPDGTFVAFQVDPISTSSLTLSGRDSNGALTGTVKSCGALLLDRPGARIVIGNLALRSNPLDVQIVSTLDPSRDPISIFDVAVDELKFKGRRDEIFLAGDLLVSAKWAHQIGLPNAEGMRIGWIQLHVAPLKTAPISTRTERVEANPATSGPEAIAETNGTDVVVSDLPGIVSYPPLGDIFAYAVGTTACNLGNQRANWIADTNQHPVIIQNMYRLRDGRFQQIGMSWVKHGFFVVAEDYCGQCADITDGSTLGVGCADTYTAGLNGAQSNMSPRSTVNAHTGYFAYPWYGIPAQTSVDRRLQVHASDLNPALNASARYFVEGHYVHPDDCLVGTQDNNASYREVLVNENTPGIYNLAITSTHPTQRGQSAIRAWRDVDPSVVENDVHVPGEGLFIVAAKASLLNSGLWRYVYAIQNLNSDRSGQSWSIQLPPGAIVENTQFFDVDYHSGEPYAQNPWVVETTSTSVFWHTDSYTTNPNANALRFDTIYTFSFDSNVEPGEGKAILGLFKPGLPQEIAVLTRGPRLTMIDCNHNGIDDPCDLDCAAQGCSQVCGGSKDCNANHVPDECDTAVLDCNHNGIPDDCDVANCPPGETWCEDCNLNLVPDICENDCDHDGIIDDCETVTDTDGDGVDDCTDRKSVV